MTWRTASPQYGARLRRARVGYSLALLTPTHGESRGWLALLTPTHGESRGWLALLTPTYIG